jgi:diaminopropionate ammonia-lyase
MIDEACAQCGAIPSHVFVQGGVGGLAAAACAYFLERYACSKIARFTNSLGLASDVG